eukprot:TRINITY_DN1083_c0_g1_i1.p1 TRINITY_DN1083_c0_g1~~TRINITY_DN1083_c0_g1_i1.p1  ORF type:complete len:662 (+),score=176.68 TRINITY_DN1083_c0_g1_i1:74-2059(+)
MTGMNGKNAAAAAPAKADATKGKADTKSKKPKKSGAATDKTEPAAEKLPAAPPAAVPAPALANGARRNGETGGKPDVPVKAVAAPAVVVDAAEAAADIAAVPVAVPKADESFSADSFVPVAVPKADESFSADSFVVVEAPQTAAAVKVEDFAAAEKVADVQIAAVATATNPVQVAAAATSPAKVVPQKTAPVIVAKAVNGSNGTLSKPAADLRALVKDGFLYVYGRVNGIMVYGRMQADETGAAMRAKAEAVMDVLKRESEKVSRKTTDVVLVVNAKLKAGAFEAEKRVVSLRDFAAGKANDGFVAVTDIAKRVPVPLRVQNTAMVVRTKTGDGIVYFKGGCMHMASRFGDSVVVVKAKGVNTYAAAQAQAEQILTTVWQAAERRRIQANGGLTMAKGKVGDLVVRVRSNVDVVQKSLEAALIRCKAAIDELTLTRALKHGMAVVGNKVNDVTLVTKDGYLYAVTRVGDATVCMKARVVQTTNATKLKIVETYASTEAAMHKIADRVVKRALESYTATKTRTLAVAEKSKSFAEQKPITASTAGGVALGGAGGGAAGLAAGVVAGAAAGLPLALFTFGLSVPIGAAVGGGAGAAVGATVGGTAGAVGGCAVGYGYERRSEIRTGLDGAKTKVAAYGEYVKTTALVSKDKLTATLRRSSAGA